MKIEKAIEILEHEVTYRDCFDDTDRYHAIKLGIRALERLEQNRTLHFIPSLKLLEGETKP